MNELIGLYTQEMLRLRGLKGANDNNRIYDLCFASVTLVLLRYNNTLNSYFAKPYM